MTRKSDIETALDRVKKPEPRVRARMADWAREMTRQTQSELEYYANSFSANERKALLEIMTQCDRLLKTL